MKKLLALLSIISFSATATTSVVSCGCKIKDDNQKVVDKILKVDNVQDEIALETNPETLTQRFDGTFISRFLDLQTKEIFDADDFKTLKITKENGEKILTTDLAIPENELKTKLNFNYGFVKNQVVDLTIKVEKEDRIIVQEIKGITNYEFRPNYEDNPAVVLSKVNGEFIEFIKRRINHKEIFDSDKYKTKRIIVGDRDLEQSDLETPDKIKAKISFDYGEDEKSQKVDFIIQGAWQIVDAKLDQSEIYVDQTTELKITNYSALRGGVKIQDNGNKVNIVDHHNGTVTLTALEEGLVDIKVTAGNAKEQKQKITLKINPWVKVEATLDKPEIYVDQTTELRIANWAALKGEPKIQGDSKVKIDNHGDGTATITALQDGTATITVTAENVREPEVLTLKISPWVKVEATLDKPEIVVNQTTELRIANWTALKGEPKIQGDSKVKIDNHGDGTATITALQDGTATITVTAENVREPEVLTLKVWPWVKIEATLDTNEVIIGQDANLTITNYQALKGKPTIKQVEGEGDVTIGEYNEGKVTLTAKQAGSVKIMISADNASEDETLTLKIWPIVKIQATLDKTEIVLGKDNSATLTISNYSALKGGAHIQVDDKVNVVDHHNGTATITAAKVGTATITITAENAQPEKLTLEVIPQVEIVAELDKPEIVVNQTTELKIANWADLKGEPKIQGDDKVQIDNHNDGTATIKGLKDGTATIIITADNAKDKTLSLKIWPWITIGTNIDKKEIIIGGKDGTDSATLTITNYQALKGGAHIQVDDKVNVADHHNGTATITAVKVGTATITVTAENAQDPKTLTIEVTLSEQGIVDAINQHEYYKKVNFASDVDTLIKDINPDFIKKDLSPDVKDIFQDDKFKLNKLYNKNKGRELRDDDLKQSNDLHLDVEINYDYSIFTNQTAQLDLEIYPAAIIDSELNDGKVSSVVHATNGYLYVGTENGRVWKIDISGEEPKQSYDLKLPGGKLEAVYSLVQAQNGKLYAGCDKASLWEIDITNPGGKPEPKKILTSFDGQTDLKKVTILISGKEKDHHIYAATGLGNVYMLDVESNKPRKLKKYRFLDWSSVNTLIQAQNGKLYAGTTGDRNENKFDGGAIWEVDLSVTGGDIITIDKPIFNFGVKNNPISDFKELEENQLVFTTQNTIYQYDLSKKGQEKKTLIELDAGGGIFSLIQGPNKEVYVATKNGKVFELDLDLVKGTANIKNDYDIGEGAAIYSLIIINNKIYAGTEDSLWELEIV